MRGVHRLWALVLSGCVAASFSAHAAAPAAPPSVLPLHAARPDIGLPGRADRFDYVTIDPQRQSLFIAHLGSGMVTIFDLSRERVIRNVTDVPGVHGVLAVLPLDAVFATATDRNQLDVISESTGKIIAHAPAGVYSDGMAYAPNAHKLFVSDEAGQTETVIDTRDNRRIATIPMGGEVGNSQYDPVTGRILVDVQTRDEIVAIDPRTDRILQPYPLPGQCNDDHSLLLDAPARLAFVACDGNAKLLLVDLRSMRVLSIHEVGRSPDVLAFDAGLQRLYVASESGVVTVFRLRDRRLQLLGRGFLAYETHSVAVDPQTHLVYFPLQNVGGRGVLRVMAPTH